MSLFYVLRHSHHQSTARAHTSKSQETRRISSDNRICPSLSDSQESYYGTGKTGLGAGNIDTYGVATKAVGSPPTVDAAGAKLETAGTSGSPSPARFAATSDYAFKMTRPGEQEKTPAQVAAMARLMK